ncbi:MAG: DUF58 domain-containing protein [Acidilobaceae archaeon]
MLRGARSSEILLLSIYIAGLLLIAFRGNLLLSITLPLLSLILPHILKYTINSRAPIIFLTYLGIISVSRVLTLTPAILPIALYILAVYRLENPPSREPREPIGYSLEVLIKDYAPLLIAIIIMPASLLPISVLLLLITLMVIINHRVLIDDEVKLLEAPRKVVARESSKILVEVKSRGGWLIASINGNITSYKLDSSRQLITIPLNIESLGYIDCDIKLWLIDQLGYTSILKVSTSIKVIAIPYAKVISESILSDVGPGAFNIIERLRGYILKATEAGVELVYARGFMLVEALVEALTGVREAEVFKYGVKSRSLENYAGSREYIPGDDARFINWKRSVARGYLIVKEYEEPPGTSESDKWIRGLSEEIRGASGSYIIVIADFTSSSQSELDSIISRLYGILEERRVADNPGSWLLVLTSRSSGVLVNGEGRDIAILIAMAIELSNATVKHEYESMNTPEGLDTLGEVKGPLTIIYDYNLKTSLEILKLIEDEVKPRHYEIINGKPTILKYSILATLMESRGYRRLITQAPSLNVRGGHR